ncbi:GNAT family N-acetyltransferase [Onishia niordana]|uniref:GNAT family N-acetyltransferase n=1 Tax=Onishia niordana TaxID=2508711 RepID=UPI00109F4006|nr:GNAT family N-acetyltransferase [Halomonas niordiana]
MNDITLTTCQGQSIAPYLEDLARLRIRVFRDFPYLYDGDFTYEAEYLSRYAECPQSLFVLAFDGEALVGAATAMPLSAEMDEFRAPFIESDYPLDSIFYYGESVLLADYRGMGIGKAFMEAREDHALRQGFTTVAFCAVEREANHPLRPADYRPLHEFWQGRGYQRIPSLATTFAWKDIDAAEETHKTLVFWVKELAA